MNNWNLKAKRLLKTELARRGIKHATLAELLQKNGIDETKAAVDSKISRGSFSASFLLQCLTVIGCTKIEIETYEKPTSLAAEPDNHNYK